jgi:hypothetical protein
MRYFGALLLGLVLFSNLSLASLDRAFSLNNEPFQGEIIVLAELFIVGRIGHEAAFAEALNLEHHYISHFLKTSRAKGARFLYKLTRLSRLQT